MTAPTPGQAAYELADPRPASMLAPVDFNDEPELTGHVSIRFPPDMIAAAKRLAAAEGMTVSAWIRREVEREAARREQPAPELAAAMAETRLLRELVREICDKLVSQKYPAAKVAPWLKRAGLPS